MYIHLRAENIYLTRFIYLHIILFSVPLPVPQYPPTHARAVRLVGGRLVEGRSLDSRRLDSGLVDGRLVDGQVFGNRLLDGRMLDGRLLEKGGSILDSGLPPQLISYSKVIFASGCDRDRLF